MRDFPIDAVKFSEHVMMFVECVAVTDQQKDSASFGEQKKNFDGVPQWELRFLTRDPERPTARPETTNVKLAAHVQPKIAAGSKPELVDLKARGWHMGDNAGVALSCSGVREQKGATDTKKAA